MLSACKEKAKEEKAGTYEPGRMNKDEYVDPYFGMTIPIPKGWSVQDRQNIRKLQEVGGQTYAGEDTSLKEAVKSQQSMVLLSVYEFPLGAQVNFNPSFSCSATDFSDAPRKISGEEFLLEAIQVLNQSPQVSIDRQGDIYKKDIDGQEFAAVDVTITVKGFQIQQRYLASSRKGYILAFILSYANEVQQKKLEELLEKIEFE